MFANIKRRIDDMKTVAALCRDAEAYALAEGQEQPGSEHFLLAALDLPDGSARQVFTRVGADPNELKSAVKKQYVQALAHVGISESDVAEALHDSAPLQRRPLPPPARASSIELLKRLANKDGLPKNVALSGALVVAAIAKEQHSVAARALRTMQIDPTRLAEAALAELST